MFQRALNNTPSETWLQEEEKLKNFQKSNVSTDLPEITELSEDIQKEEQEEYKKSSSPEQSISSSPQHSFDDFLNITEDIQLFRQESTDDIIQRIRYFSFMKELIDQQPQKQQRNVMLLNLKQIMLEDLCKLLGLILQKKGQSAPQNIISYQDLTKQVKELLSQIAELSETYTTDGYRKTEILEVILEEMKWISMFEEDNISSSVTNRQQQLKQQQLQPIDWADYQHPAPFQKLVQWEMQSPEASTLKTQKKMSSANKPLGFQWETDSSSSLSTSSKINSSFRESYSDEKRQRSNKDTPLKHQQFMVTKNYQIKGIESSNFVALSNRDFLNVVNYSNSMLVVDSSRDLFNTTRQYQALVDDHPLCNFIIDSLAKRKWWKRLPRCSQETLDKANFVWSKTKQSSYCKKMHSAPKHSQTVRQKKVIKKVLFCEPQNHNEEDSIYYDYLRKLLNNNDFTYVVTSKLKQSESILEPPFVSEQQTHMDSEEIYALNFQPQKELLIISTPAESRLHNHLQYSFALNMKQGLFSNLIAMNPNIRLPEIFMISGIHYNKEFDRLMQFISQNNNSKHAMSHSLLVLKIAGSYSSDTKYFKSICSYPTAESQLRNIFSQKESAPLYVVVQEYIPDPFLLKGKKFRIKKYLLITSFNSSLKGYLYKSCCIETAQSLYSKEIKKDFSAQLVGTDNIAEGNLSLLSEISDEGLLENYINSQRQSKKNQKRFSFEEQILPQIMELAKDCIHSTYQTLNPSNKQFRFELIQLDFLMDTSMKIWLIDSGPVLKFNESSYHEKQLFSRLVENIFTLVVDPLFPPPLDEQIDAQKSRYIQEFYKTNLFELIFTEETCPKQSTNDHLYDGLKDIARKFFVAAYEN